jgi:hypothetical protein
MYLDGAINSVYPAQGKLDPTSTPTVVITNKSGTWELYAPVPVPVMMIDYSELWVRDLEPEIVEWLRINDPEKYKEEREGRLQKDDFSSGRTL